MATLIVTCLAIVSMGGPYAEIRGMVPSAFGPVSRILWIDADDREQDARCQLQPPRAWTCEGITPESHGLVVLTTDGGVAAFPLGIGDGAGVASIAPWGRVLRVSAGGMAADDLRDLRATAWKPDRSGVRRHTQRFVPVEDASVHVLRLSNTAFWIFGGDVDVDGFIQLEGPAVASLRMRTKTLAGESPDIPHVVAAVAPFSVDGRVQSARGQDVEAAGVELFEPFSSAGAPQERESKPIAQMIRRATAITRADGTFTFDHLPPGRYEILATHESLGRGTTRVERLSEPIVVTLIAPVRAVGRVVRRGLPMAGSRVRFVPDQAAWLASTDPVTHLAAETITDDQGRFALVLPPERTGSIQIVAIDGAVTRLPLSARSATGDLMLGDIALVERRRLTVRLLDAVACDLVAVGPLGTLGMSIVHATSASGVYWFELPEPGRWALNAECGGKSHSVEPTFIAVPSEGPEVTIAAQLKGGDS